MVWKRVDICLAIHRSAINWIEWADCYDHKGPLQDLSVLTSPSRCKTFVVEYRLVRWIGGEQDRHVFCAAVRSSSMFQQAILECRPELIDGCAAAIRDKSGNRTLSALSKLATFLRPDQFMPYDRLAKIALRELGSKPKALECYSTYLGEIKQRVPLKLKRDILREISSFGLRSEFENRRGFRLRVIDQILVQLGRKLKQQPKLKA